MSITYSENNIINFDQLCSFFKIANSRYVKNPIQLSKALQNSDYLLTAWDGDNLVGLCNTISDGYMFVSVPFFLILPEQPATEIAQEFVSRIKKTYVNFSELIIVSENCPHTSLLNIGFNDYSGALRLKR